jgi:hypothetical protein
MTDLPIGKALDTEENENGCEGCVFYNGEPVDVTPLLDRLELCADIIRDFAAGRYVPLSLYVGDDGINCVEAANTLELVEQWKADHARD